MLARRDVDAVIIATPLPLLDNLQNHYARLKTGKTRVVTSRNQQVARIDYEEDAEVDGTAAAELVSRIETLAATATEATAGERRALRARAGA